MKYANLNDEEKRARDSIIQYAIAGNVITYSELNEIAKLGFDLSIPDAMSALLNNISIWDYHNTSKEFLLSSIVVKKMLDEKGMPGRGFFDLANSPGYKNPNLNKNASKSDIFEYHKAECFDFWQKQENKDAYKEYRGDIRV